MLLITNTGNFLLFIIRTSFLLGYERNNLYKIISFLNLTQFLVYLLGFLWSDGKQSRMYLGPCQTSMRLMKLEFKKAHIKTHSHYLILFRKHLYKFSEHRKYLIKSLFNEFKIIKLTWQQRLNKPLNEHYRQIVVYLTYLC